MLPSQSIYNPHHAAYYEQFGGNAPRYLQPNSIPKQKAGMVKYLRLFFYETTHLTSGGLTDDSLMAIEEHAQIKKNVQAELLRLRRECCGNLPIQGGQLTLPIQQDHNPMLQQPAQAESTSTSAHSSSDAVSSSTSSTPVSSSGDSAVQGRPRPTAIYRLSVYHKHSRDNIHGTHSTAQHSRSSPGGGEAMSGSVSDAARPLGSSPSAQNAARVKRWQPPPTYPPVPVPFGMPPLAPTASSTTALSQVNTQAWAPPHPAPFPMAATVFGAPFHLTPPNESCYPGYYPGIPPMPAASDTASLEQLNRLQHKLKQSNQRLQQLQQNVRRREQPFPQTEQRREQPFPQNEQQQLQFMQSLMRQHQSHQAATAAARLAGPQGATTAGSSGQPTAQAATPANGSSNANGADDAPGAEQQEPYEHQMTAELRAVGFTDSDEMLSSIRLLKSQQSDLPTIDDIICHIISVREETVEAKKMDQARVLSEQSRKDEAHRLRRAHDEELLSQMQAASVEEWLTNEQMFPQSWLLLPYQHHRQGLDSNGRQHTRCLGTLVETDTSSKFKLLTLCQLEKKAQKWFLMLPRAYFCVELRDKWLDHFAPASATTSNHSRNEMAEALSAVIQEAIDVVERAMYTLELQTNGVPSLFLSAHDQHASIFSSHQEEEDGDGDVVLVLPPPATTTLSVESLKKRGAERVVTADRKKLCLGGEEVGMA
jgi:hypothetical protein